MVERPIKLIDSVRAKRIAHFRPIESDADDAVGALGPDVAVIRNVCEVLEPGNRFPQLGVEGLVSIGMGGGVFV